jgi:hypothetical protein
LYRKMILLQIVFLINLCKCKSGYEADKKKKF